MPEVVGEKPQKMIAKICLFGDACVGKTSLIRRYVLDQFDDAYISTIGTKITKKVVNIKSPEDGKPVEFTLMLWDIVGQKAFRQLLKDAYFSGANAAIGVCDSTRKETLEDLTDWRQSIVKVTGEIPIVFLANKSDLSDKIAFSKEDLKDMMGSYMDSLGEEKVRKMLLRARDPCLFTSAKTGWNVEKAFYTVCETLI